MLTNATFDYLELLDYLRANAIKYIQMKKAIKWILIVFCLLAAIAATVFFTAGKKYYITRVVKYNTGGIAYIYIKPQDNAESVAKKIESIAGERAREAFMIFARHNNFNAKKRSGKYAINNGETMKDIYYRIVSNTQTPVKLTVPSTRTIQQAVGEISKQLMLDSLELSKYTTNQAYFGTLGYTKETLHSFFIPETYEVYWDIAPDALMTRLANERRNFWNKERMAKAEALGMTPEQVATLASIVDEETNNKGEMPTVAGLYINRLKKGMLLQADPTVKFAIGDPTRKRILKEDLETESPYNTYKHKGLPPGPIRIPTKQAIESVLNYEKHNYLYMCAKEDLSGTHNFSSNLSEHNANARRYHQALNKLKIKK